MFEVNFFEKKQKNFLPYLISGVFLFLLLLVGIYFFSMQAYYTNGEKQNQEWLQNEADQLSVSRKIQEFDLLTQQVAGNKATLESMQYPMAYVTNAILEQVPNGEKQVSIFNKNETNQITLVLEGLTATELSDTVEKFKALSFVSTVHFIRVENQVEGAGSIVELWLEIDETALGEEVLS